MPRPRSVADGGAKDDETLLALREQAGLTERHVVRVPALFNRLDVPAGYPRRDVVANDLPGAANGVSTGTGGYLAPRQHAPETDRDVFERAAEKALSGTGTPIFWVEDWACSHHLGTVGGKVHCATNALRSLSGTRPWWTERD
ncbi:protein-arginine deiminase family protein [Streptomyces sp. JV185]|uniref:protein-arginine deiminase family protein n=1 Tax=Streptomyces sp. JV185 TaxID=858638 RepID=UPI002E786695|nr:protein-arginine deiminase family protein [Streptomyces sp. JV185]MEE1770275.1 protein-arginine deiminase family protein [Streptomyces sp. JV185]